MNEHNEQPSGAVQIKLSDEEAQRLMESLFGNSDPHTRPDHNELTCPDCAHARQVGNFTQVVNAGGYVRRYHTRRTIRDQTVAHHSANVALFAGYIAGNWASANLYRACLVHDLAESEYGDIPKPAKDLIGREDLHKMEALFLEAVGLKIELTPIEQWIMHMADALEGLMYTTTEVHMGNNELKYVWASYRRYCHRILHDQLTRKLYTVPEGLDIEGILSRASELYASIENHAHIWHNRIVEEESAYTKECASQRAANGGDHASE